MLMVSSPTVLSLVEIVFVCLRIHFATCTLFTYLLVHIATNFTIHRVFYVGQIFALFVNPNASFIQLSRQLYFDSQQVLIAYIVLFYMWTLKISAIILFLFCSMRHFMAASKIIHYIQNNSVLFSLVDKTIYNIRSYTTQLCKTKDKTKQAIVPWSLDYCCSQVKTNFQVTSSTSPF